MLGILASVVRWFCYALADLHDPGLGEAFKLGHLTGADAVVQVLQDALIAVPGGTPPGDNQGVGLVVAPGSRWGPALVVE